MAAIFDSAITNLLRDRGGNELIQRNAVNLCKFGSYTGRVDFR